MGIRAVQMQFDNDVFAEIYFSHGIVYFSSDFQILVSTEISSSNYINSENNPWYKGIILLTRIQLPAYK